MYLLHVKITCYIMLCNFSKSKCMCYPIVRSTGQLAGRLFLD